MEKLTFKVNVEKDKLLKFLCDTNCNLSYSVLNKLLRKKDIKINGKRTNENVDVTFGDIIDVFVLPEVLEKKTDNVSIIYEDSNTIVANKPRGKEVITDAGYDFLSDIQAYIKQTDSNTKVRAVHRLDKNTAGLVVFAKTDIAENELLDAFKNRTIKKFYTATVEGLFPFKEATKRAYLKKDSKLAKVFISDTAKAGYEQIITKFKTIKKSSTTTDLEVELITGKTHQIRAHLAHLGFPLVGDDKYGSKASKNQKFNLTSTKIVFSFKPESPLYYLNGKQILLNK